MKYIHFFLFSISLLFITSCERDFDEPPVRELPTFEANSTIADVQALHTLGEDDRIISDDMIVRATVISSDEAGNFFRNLIIQDATGGLEVRLNSTGLYNQFPRGSDVFLRLQGLYVGDFNGIYQINGSPESQIEEARIADVISSASQVEELNPNTININQINPGLVGTLVRFDNVQFSSESVRSSFSNGSENRAVNHTIEDCSGNNIILRTSGFADFANDLTPDGNGSITAVLSIFDSNGTVEARDYQLLISTPEDISFTGDRCGPGGVNQGGNTGSADLVSVSDVKGQFMGVETFVTDNTGIKGIVISDFINGNMTGRNLVLQDGDAGIVVRFDDNHSFELGDELEINISGNELSEFNGLLQVNNVSINSASVISTGNSVEPKEYSVEFILGNVDLLESTLVKIVGANMGGSSTYNGGTTVTDNTGTIDMFTRSSATFSDSSLPTGTVDLVAIVSEFNAPQVAIRNLDDVTVTGESGGEMGGNMGTGEIMSISDLRNVFMGNELMVMENTSITGIVISDYINGNITGRNLVLQEGNSGIVVRFNDNHSFELGDELEINISGNELSEFNGLLQVNNVANESAMILSSGKMVEPTEYSVQFIMDNLESLESTLVKVKGVMISGADTYNGATMVSDASGTIDMFTRSSASFSDTALPDERVDMVVIVSEFNTPQIALRNLDDVTSAEGGDTGGMDGGNTGGMEEFGLTEDFESYAMNTDFAGDNWLNFAEVGSGNTKWFVNDFSGNQFIEINPFNSGENNLVVWLIVSTNDATSLSYETATHHWVHNGLSVWTSDSFDGNNFDAAQFNKIDDAQIVSNPADTYSEFEASGDIPLSDGTRFVAWRYEGDSNSNTTAFRLDNVILK